MKCKALFLLVVLLFFSCKTEVKTQDSVLEYLLPNATLIVKISHLAAFKSELTNNAFLQKTQGLPFYTALIHALQGLEYVAGDTSCLLALYEVGKATYEFVLIAKDRPDFLTIDKVTNKTVETFPYQDKSLVQYTLNGYEFYTMRHDTEIVLSSSLMLMENMVRVKKNNPVHATLQKLYETNAPGKSATLFAKVNAPFFPLSPPQVAKGKGSKPFSEWVALDFSANSDKVLLNGIAMASDSTQNFISLFKGTSPLANKTPLYAPSHTQAMLSYTFDDYQVFAQNQNAYLDRVSVVDSLFNTIEEVGLIYLNEQKVVLLHSYGAERLSDYLRADKSSTTSYRGKEIMQLQNKMLLEEGFTPLVQDFKASFCVILENTFVFAESKAPLQTLISTHGTTSALSNAPAYQTATHALASASSMLFMANASGMHFFAEHGLLPQRFATAESTDLPEYAFASQLVADRGFAHLTLGVSKIRKATANHAVTPLFTLALDTDLAIPPQFVKNHRTHKQEIVVQDQNHVLYLISTEGQVLWKKPLGGRIRGPIQQVDLYKNGRLQLAFCTHNQFLILDRNGKEVLPFNKTFTGPALNPLAVFDYEGKKNYRFVVTQGKKVFMYNNKGKIVDGFTYTRAQSPIIAAPKHFRVGYKDYLVFQLADKTLKILHRSGKDRIKVREKIDFSANPVFLYKNKFSVTNTKGVLHQIDTEGALTATPFKLHKDHGMYATANTLVFMSDHTLSIKGKKVELDLGVYTAPKIFYYYDKIYVSVTDLQHQKIYMFDSQAKSLPNFPVFGASLIDVTDMDNDTSLELVAKDQANSLIVYKMN